MAQAKQQWGSKLGFILAASGSAIGLGNIVFFSANAYKFGAGAFYLPYLVALVTVGIPVMILEFGLGRFAGGSFPAALRKIGGEFGEAAGWWTLINASLIMMYYVTILGWVAGMWIAALTGSLWEPAAAVEAFGLPAGALTKPMSTFFNLISSWGNVIGVVVVWLLNIAILIRGTKSIETALKVLLPLMWIMMLALVVRGLSLEGGFDGIVLLFNPDFSVIGDPAVWQGAFSQIFFTLSLGFGVMTAYASYLPKDADHISNSVVVSALNCTFELIAGLAVFSILFAYALLPKTSTLAMMFFVVPQGIDSMPVGAMAFGVLFFTLLLMAGLSSSVSLVEGAVAALVDRFRMNRTAALLGVVAFCAVGSVAFALPVVINATLSDNGTLGLTLLDLIDHYTFGYGLLIVGLIECIAIGWFLPVKKLRETLNESSGLPLGPWFDVLIKFIVPAILLGVLGLSLKDELSGGSLYGAGWDNEGWMWLPQAGLAFWLIVPAGLAAFLAKKATRQAAKDAGNPGGAL